MSPTHPSTPRRPRAVLLARLALAPLLALGAVGVAVTPALAHSGMTGSDPADASTVDTAPDQVTLSFNEAPQSLGTEVVVLDPDGAVVSEGATTVADVTVTQPLAPERPAGAYTIQWRVTSADGHPLSGELTFTATTGVGAPATETPTEDSSPTAPEPADSSEPAAPAPSTETPAATAGTSGADEQLTWQWGTASVVVIAVIAAVVVALGVVVARSRRRAATGRDEHGEPADQQP